MKLQALKDVRTLLPQSVFDEEVGQCWVNATGSVLTTTTTVMTTSSTTTAAPDTITKVRRCQVFPAPENPEKRISWRAVSLSRRSSAAFYVDCGVR